MASHAYTTTPLLRPVVRQPGLLRMGSSSQLGPVTRAIRAMQANLCPSVGMQPVQCQEDWRTLHTLRRSIARQIEEDQKRIERCLIILDALDGDPDFEPSMGFVPTPYLDEAEGDERSRDPDLEPSLCGVEAMAYRQDIFSIDVEEDEHFDPAIADLILRRQAA